MKTVRITRACEVAGRTLMPGLTPSLQKEVADALIADGNAEEWAPPARKREPEPVEQGEEE